MEKPDFTQETKPEANRPKRKTNPEADSTAPRPRKLRFSPQQDPENSHEEDDEDGDEDVPTPTSSPDAEDADIFAKTKAQPSQAQTGAAVTFETPPSKTSKASDPGSNASLPTAEYDQDVKDIMATMEDKLLETMPSGLSRWGLLHCKLLCMLHVKDKSFLTVPICDTL